MKLKYLYLICALFAASINYYIYQSSIKGVVVSEAGELLIGASVVVKDSDIGTVTDINGKFELSIPISATTLVFSYMGYEHAEIAIDDTQFLKVVLKKSKHLLEEVVVTGDRKRSYERDLSTTGATVSTACLKGKTSGISIAETEKSKIFIRGTKSMTATDFKDAVSFNESRQPAGQITAGEWNDLDNWEDWKSLNENPDYLEMQSYWALFPNKRYSVFVTNQYDFPVPNCQVSLLDKNGISIWEAKTDHAGKAELWQNFNQENENAQSIQIKSHSTSFDIKSIHSIEKGAMYLKIKEDCEKFDQIDLAFVVDATGSMGDEIAYLKAELLDVMDRAKNLRPNLEFNYGSVFYRDSTDTYLTQELSMTSKSGELIDFISRQEAGGGGDYPEAVEAGLEAALNFSWNENAIARLLFILLDSPPHHNPAVLHDLNMQIREAAARGIKIIPISASGINRQTEFLMKFMSIATNGTYVFITDDSGIGNPHLAPVVENFDVELLNDLVLRLIENYSKTSRCSSNQEIVESQIKIYPNPCYNFANVELQEPARSVHILSASGKQIKEFGNLGIGVNKLSFEQLISGVYTLHFIFENRQESKQIILLNG